MSNSIKVSVSILCADFANLAGEIKKIDDSGADMIHIDIMDGHFVGPVTIGPLLVKAIRPLTKLPIDAHLMVEHPETMIQDLVDAGVDSISVHAECFGVLKDASRGFGKFPKELETFDAVQARSVLSQIKEFGKEAFLVVNPGTDIELLEPVLGEVDGVLIMSVHPGFSHQKFIASVLSKAVWLRERFSKHIAIDGGINAETAAEAVEAGIDILATASYFFTHQNPSESVAVLKNMV